MSNPLTMFQEKNERGELTWSMTRVVAFAGSLTFNAAFLYYARGGKEINWPMCALGAVTLMCVPLQALFKYVQMWFSSSPGQKIVRELMTRLPSLVGASPTTTVKTEVTTPSTPTPPTDTGIL